MGRLRPARNLVLGYLAVIFVGALLLWLPPFHRGSLSPVDALFTSTSAVCVTGLIVVDTATKFTPLGKAVLAALIEIGGLSYVTFASLFLFYTGKRDFGLESMMRASFSHLKFSEVWTFAKRAILTTGLAQSIGFFLLLYPFVRDAGLPGVGHALFQSISAFCNAGFSTFSSSLVAWREDPLVVGTITGLIIFGGLGFIVLWDIFDWLRRRKRRLAFHTKVVLAATGLLLSLAFLFYLAVEWEGAFAGMPLGEKLLASWFAAVTPRTAGFNTVAYSALSSASLLFTMVLMAVGGSPGGTAGGMKTTTLAAVLLWLRAALRREREAHFLGRRLPDEVLRDSLAILILALSTVLLSTLAISILENPPFLPLLFEVVSAFGTVGLSLGAKGVANASLSADFGALSKGIIIITMLIGRIGVLTVFTGLISARRAPVRYPKANLVVG